MSFMNSSPKSKSTPEDELNELVKGCINFTAKNNAEEGRKKNSIYPSQFAYCPRYNYKTIGKESEPLSEPSQIVYIEIGNTIEKIIQNSLENCGILLDCQRYLSFDYRDPKVDLGGYIDFIIDFQGKPAIIEVKTTSSIQDQKTETYLKKGVISEKTSIQHLTQCMIYSAFTGIDDVYLYYVSRRVQEQFNGGLETYVEKVDTSYDKLYNIMHRVYFTQLCIENSKEPPKLPNFKKTIHCKYCNFTKECWDVEHTEDYLSWPEWIDAESLAKEFLGNRTLRYQAIYKELYVDKKS